MGEDEGLDQELTRDQRVFLYMPFQHSEDRDDQARAIALYAMLGKPLNLDFALRHQEVVDRFDRFPHRNVILGRPSTEEEKKFLTEPGSSFAVGIGAGNPADEELEAVGEDAEATC